MQEDNFHHRWDTKAKLLRTVTLRGEANKVTDYSCQVAFVSQMQRKPLKYKEKNSIHWVGKERGRVQGRKKDRIYWFIQG